MNLARSSLKLFVANITTAGVQFVGISYFARELGPSQMGIFFLFQALLGMLAIPADFGLRGAVEKRISEGKYQGKFVSSAVVLKLIPLTGIVIGILLLQPHINNYLGANFAIYLAAAIVLQEFSQLAVSILKGELRVGETAVLNVARQITWVGMGVLLVNYGLKAEGLIYGLLAGMSVMLVWGWYKNTISIEDPSVSHTRSLFNYGKYNVISSIGGYFYSWMDVAIIGLFLTQKHVGAYEIAWRVTAVSILFSKAIAATIFPQISEWETDGAKERIENIIPSVLTPSLLLVIPSFFGTIVLSNEILRIIFSQEYTSAAIVLILLMGDKVFQAIQLVVGRSLQAINRPDLAARATIVSVVLNAVLNVIFVLYYGIVGAAVATVVSSLTNDFLHLIYLRRFIRVEFPRREIMECIFASTMMMVVLKYIKEVYRINNVVELIAVISLGAAIYATFVVLLPNLRRHAYKIFNHIRISQ